MPRMTVELQAETLKNLLQQFGVDISEWGKGEANTVERFLQELGEQESVLRFYNDGTIARVLRIVKLVITDPEKGTLLEDYHILPDGRRRDRQMTPGGKIGNHETPVQAVIRETDEELHLSAGSRAHGLPDDFFDGYGDCLVEMEPSYVEEKASKSYPTLRTIYEIHPAKISLFDHVKIEDGYNTIDKEDGKKRLFFKWDHKPANQNPKS